MRRVHAWVGGSAALACAAMAVALYLSDLETLSWIASAGSFVAAVSSLVLAFALTRVPASHPDLPAPAHTKGGPVPVVLHLTTFATRIGDRAVGALYALLMCAGLYAFIVLLLLLKHGAFAQAWAEIQDTVIANSCCW